MTSKLLHEKNLKQHKERPTDKAAPQTYNERTRQEGGRSTRLPSAHARRIRDGALTAEVSWKPEPDQTTRDIDVLDRFVGRAIQGLAPADPTLKRDVARFLRSWVGSRKLSHPEIFHWYFSARPVLSRESIAELNEVRAKVLLSEALAAANRNMIGLAVDTAPNSAGVVSSLFRGARYAERLAKAPVNLEPLAELDTESQCRIKSACALIREVWPEVLDEFPSFVKKMIVYRGHAVIGFTDFRYHGSIFLKHEWLMRRNTIAEVAEDLIHEAAHVRLNAIMGARPMLLNDDTEIYASPLRQDLRSMYGVFHQMFVLFRVAEFYRRLAGRGMEVPNGHLNHARADFRLAYGIVKSSAVLTRVGRQMLKSIENDMAAVIEPRSAPNLPSCLNISTIAFSRLPVNPVS